MNAVVYPWRPLLEHLSVAVLTSVDPDDQEYVRSLSSEVITSGWLGYRGAREDELSDLEARLGVTLPPSYRQFLAVSNGWPSAPPLVNTFWPTEEVAWFRVRHQDWIDTALELAVRFNEPWPSDEEYFVYGEKQVPFDYRREYLQTALEISAVNTTILCIHLLNPQVVTPEGEWEAWSLSTNLPSADRYRTFWDLMQSEYQAYTSSGQVGGC